MFYRNHYRGDSPHSTDGHNETYFDNRPVAPPPADLPPPGPPVSCIPFKDCRKCGQPVRKHSAICEACFAEMQARAERQEEIV
jgi:hypothetical protein